LAFAWLVVLGVVLLQMWPSVPRTKHQWVLCIVFGPPLYVLGEAAAEMAFSGNRDRGSSKGFPFKFIIAGVLVGVAVFAGASWILTKP